MKLVDEVVLVKKLVVVVKKLLKVGVDLVKLWDKKGYKFLNGKVYFLVGFQFWLVVNVIYWCEIYDNYFGVWYLLYVVVEGF